MSDQVEETPTPEPDAATPTEVAPPSPETQAGFAVLLEREAANETARTELRAREAKVAQWEKMETMSPAEKAQALGISLNDLQKAMVDDYDPNAALTTKLTALEARIKQQDEARDNAALDAARQVERNKVRTFIDGSDEFLITKTSGYHDTVIDAVRMSAESGKPLSEAQAASNVEAGLFDLVEKAMSIPQIRERILGKAKEAPTPSATSSSPLTNRAASASSQPRSTDVLLEGEDALDAFMAML